MIRAHPWLSTSAKYVETWKNPGSQAVIMNQRDIAIEEHARAQNPSRV